MANELRPYARSLDTPIWIQFRGKTQRPIFTLSAQDCSVLASEQRSGISGARYHQIVDALSAPGLPSRMPEDERREEASPNHSALCISCSHVVEDGESVLWASHSGGDWVLICGRADRHSGHENGETLRVIHWEHLLDRDPSLEEIIPGLGVDYSAERGAVGEKWRKFFDPDTDV